MYLNKAVSMLTIGVGRGGWGQEKTLFIYVSVNGSLLFILSEQYRTDVSHFDLRVLRVLRCPPCKDLSNTHMTTGSFI